MFPIFKKLGERVALKIARGANKPDWPTLAARKRWRSNGVLPGPVILPLMRHCDRKGIPYSSEDFMLPRKNKTKRRAKR